MGFILACYSISEVHQIKSLRISMRFRPLRQTAKQAVPDAGQQRHRKFPLYHRIFLFDTHIFLWLYPRFIGFSENKHLALPKTACRIHFGNFGVLAFPLRFHICVWKIERGFEKL